MDLICKTGQHRDYLCKKAEKKIEKEKDNMT